MSTMRYRTDRPVCVAFGSESFYALRDAGWTETAPQSDGDASNPLRVMNPPGYREPARPIRRRARGERAPADRRHGR
jgi:hypothetical protein